MTEAQSSQADRVTRTAEVWERRGDFGVVLLSADADAPVTLSGTAVAVWDALEFPRSVDAVVTELSERFASAEPVVRRDVAALLDDLGREGLVTRS